MAHHIVVGALVGPEGVLVAHRRPDREHAPDRWDFAGGHVEPGETSDVALRRELVEELGISATVSGAPRLQFAERDAECAEVILELWIITDWVGVPRNAAPDEHDELRWVDPAELRHLDLVHPAYDQIFAELAMASMGPPTDHVQGSRSL